MSFINELPDTACLVIEWESLDDWNHRATYYLRLPIRPSDIRRDEFPDGFQKLIINTTDRNGDLPDPEVMGYVDTPFRDCSHILWDSEQLRLPGYAVHGDKITALCCFGFWAEGHRGGKR